MSIQCYFAQYLENDDHMKLCKKGSKHKKYNKTKNVTQNCLFLPQ